MTKATTLLKPKPRMKCPQCSNVIDVTVHPNGGIAGKCPYCKVTFFSKEKSAKERLIRIIQH